MKKTAVLIYNQFWNFEIAAALENVVSGRHGKKKIPEKEK